MPADTIRRFRVASRPAMGSAWAISGADPSNERSFTTSMSSKAVPLAGTAMVCPIWSAAPLLSGRLRCELAFDLIRERFDAGMRQQLFELGVVGMRVVAHMSRETADDAQNRRQLGFRE